MTVGRYTMTYKLDEIAYRGEFWFLKNKRTGMLIKQCRVAPFIFFSNLWTKINVPVKAPMGESNILYRLYHISQCNPLWWFWFEYAWCRSRRADNQDFCCHSNITQGLKKYDGKYIYCVVRYKFNHLAKNSTTFTAFTMKNFNGKPDFVRCLLVQNGLWPADFSTMYSNFEHFIPVTSVQCREVNGPESVLNQ